MITAPITTSSATTTRSAPLPAWAGATCSGAAKGASCAILIVGHDSRQQTMPRARVRQRCSTEKIFTLIDGTRVVEQPLCHPRCQGAKPFSWLELAVDQSCESCHIGP